MTTLLYGCMHFLVDFLCAWAMFGSFRDRGPEIYLVYNFCAFALQMPLGTLLDLIGKPRSPRLWAILGAAVTAAGSVTHPALLGLGNALFHVGGGVEVIGADFARQRKGRELGIFVAPGALGLFCGTLLGKNGFAPWLPMGTGLLLLLLSAGVLRGKIHSPKELPSASEGTPMLPFSCFAVVILRSFVGMSVSFPWKTGTGMALLAVAAVVLGKIAGGYLAVGIGMDRAVFWSLLMAAGAFLLGDRPGFGLTALLLFNMSMPMTLYMLACRMPKMPGFAFGLLTFGLYLGFLPVYGGVSLPVSGGMLGAAGSMLSLMLLILGRKAVGKSRETA